MRCVYQPCSRSGRTPAWNAHMPPVADTSQPAIVEAPHAEPVAAEEPFAAAAEHDLEPPSLDDFLLAEPPAQENAAAAEQEPVAEELTPLSIDAEPVEAEPVATEPAHVDYEAQEPAPIAEVEASEVAEAETEQIEPELAAPANEPTAPATLLVPAEPAPSTNERPPQASAAESVTNASVEWRRVLFPMPSG